MPIAGVCGSHCQYLYQMVGYSETCMQKIVPKEVLEFVSFVALMRERMTEGEKCSEQWLVIWGCSFWG